MKPNFYIIHQIHSYSNLSLKFESITNTTLTRSAPVKSSSRTKVTKSCLQMPQLSKSTYTPPPYLSIVTKWTKSRLSRTSTANFSLSTTANKYAQRKFLIKTHNFIDFHTTKILEFQERVIIRNRRKANKLK